MRCGLRCLGLMLTLAMGFGTVAGAMAQATAAPPANPAHGMTAPAVDWAETPVRLLMVEQRGCIYCARWNAEIGEGYANTAEGRAAPLLRVDVDGPWPDGLTLGAQPQVTPTFILLDRGEEIARMPGYVGDQYFYPLLDQMLDKLPENAAAAVSETSGVQE